ncbi:MAG TPA: gephyrin-like molybdotransferase Glp [Xanthomonadaceae bacterium]|nr:gephyrin-like molybdotransferase Glp [Xanthomonadaceae bacterium]
MIGYDEALAAILREARPLASESRPVAQALGRILAAGVASPDALPPFDNSAMDGFALRAGDATLSAGRAFDVRGAQVAGDAQADATADAGGAWEIMTGARLPEGFDTVVPVEQVEVLAQEEGRPRRIRLAADAARGQHVRRRGEDVPLHVEVLPAGARVQPQQLMLLSALGVADVRVARRPKAAILTTGRELVDDPAQPLASGEIRNCNGPFLAARIAEAGAEVVCRRTVGDDPALFRAALAEALAAGAEVVVSTGAVSMGRHDFVPDTLRALGARQHFHKVRIRPGKPLLFARLAGGALYFGLPGNPVSCAVGLRFFVEPALRAMLGLAPERPLRVPLAEAFGKRAPLRFHLKGRLDCDDTGRLRAHVLPGQESFRILPLAAGNAWIVIGEETDALAAGALVEVHGLGHLQPPSWESVAR